MSSDIEKMFGVMGGFLFETIENQELPKSYFFKSYKGPADFGIRNFSNFITAPIFYIMLSSLSILIMLVLIIRSILSAFPTILKINKNEHVALEVLLAIIFTVSTILIAAVQPLISLTELCGGIMNTIKGEDLEDESIKQASVLN